jgi:hypothetical protein
MKQAVLILVAVMLGVAITMFRFEHRFVPRSPQRLLGRR